MPLQSIPIPIPRIPPPPPLRKMHSIAGRQFVEASNLLTPTFCRRVSPGTLCIARSRAEGAFEVFLTALLFVLAAPSAGFVALDVAGYLVEVGFAFCAREVEAGGAGLHAEADGADMGAGVEVFGDATHLVVDGADFEIWMVRVCERAWLLLYSMQNNGIDEKQR